MEVGVNPTSNFIVNMTILEQRFLESVPRELRRLNENLEHIVELLDEIKNGTDIRKRI